MLCWILVCFRVKPLAMPFFRQVRNFWHSFFMLEWSANSEKWLFLKTVKKILIYLSFSLTYLWQIPGRLSLANAWPDRFWISYSWSSSQAVMANALGDCCTLTNSFLSRVGEVRDHSSPYSFIQVLISMRPLTPWAWPKMNFSGIPMQALACPNICIAIGKIQKRCESIHCQGVKLVEL